MDDEYTAEDEIAYLRDLEAHGRLDVLLWQLRLILGGHRFYDLTVNMPRLREAARTIWQRVA